MKDWKEHESVAKACSRFFRVFFEGEPLSQLEREIELRYLSLKQAKWLQFLRNKKLLKYKVIWTASNQRSLDLMLPSIHRNQLLFSNFYPLYERLNLSSKEPIYQQMMELAGADNFISRFIYKMFVAGKHQKSKKMYDNVSFHILNRLAFYVNSLEFARVLDIQPDFHITHAIVNLHIWLLVDRLKRFKTKSADYLVYQIERNFKEFTVKRVGKIHLRKKNDFIKDLNMFMLANRMSYDRHFNKHPLTARNPLIRLDALVWSTVFFEKVKRYDNCVYIFAEYLIEHQKYPL